MSAIKVAVGASNKTTVVATGNNGANVSVAEGYSVNLEVKPQPRVDLRIDRGIAGPQGPQGPQGPPGNSNIGGYDVEVADLQNRDVLMFNGFVWSNTPQTEISDGGNF